MRISKLTWIILGVGVFAIGLGALYMLYNQQITQQKSLTEQIAAAQASLSKASADRAGTQNQLGQIQSDVAKLQDDLAKARSQLATAGSGMPKTVESIEYAEKLFTMAQGLNLEVTSFTSSEPGSTQIQSLSFGSTVFTINVKGATGNVLALVDAIAKSSDFTSASVELVDMKKTDPKIIQEFIDVEPKVIPQFIGTINLSIFSYKG